jgi:mono/diheme cytochrome c family protein
MAAQESGKNWVLGAARVGAVGLTVVALLLTAALLYREGTWVRPELKGPKEAFFDRSIGTELIPLPVIQVLPELVREQKHFAPLGEEAGDWIDQFGFIRPEGEGTEGLPVGFTLSNYRPKSGAPSPVRFVGIGCATCHSSLIRRPDGTTFFVAGTGNASLNLFAWLDALQAAMLDEERVTLSTIKEAYRKKYEKDLGFEETQMIRVWLAGFRKTLRENEPRFDAPFGGGESLTEAAAPTGPGRTQPFRTLVRSVLERPGSDMKVFTKIAPVFHEDWQEWAQVDGGIRGLNSRSALAVLAAGATTQNMAVPEIAHNIVKATDYVRDLRGPTFAEVFPDLAAKQDRKAIDRGRDVFRKHCATCHGQPGPNGSWTRGERFGEVVKLAEINTDPERVTFRYFDELPDRVYEHFPEKHPFKFPREDLRPGPLGSVKGYMNKPLDSVFTRAPYLHNASVLTLAELINLEPRREVFFRGKNVFDVRRVGLLSPPEADKHHYFRFDTTARGNSNRGHDYPWRYKDEKAGWNKKDLEDLLEYLKTL